MNLRVPPPPSGDFHEKLAYDLIKKIPFLGKILGASETVWKKEKNAAKNIRVHSVDLWEILQNKALKKEELEKAKIQQSRGHKYSKRIASINRELTAFKGYINKAAGQLNTDVIAYEEAIKKSFQNKEKFCKAMKKYVDSSKRGII
ncbi:hypothetical protein ACFLZE_04850 [Thermodesulfobacteriota bacterium]